MFYRYQPGPSIWHNYPSQLTKEYSTPTSLQHSHLNRKPRPKRSSDNVFTAFAHGSQHIKHDQHRQTRRIVSCAVDLTRHSKMLIRQQHRSFHTFDDGIPARMQCPVEIDRLEESCANVCRVLRNQLVDHAFHCFDRASGNRSAQDRARTFWMHIRKALLQPLENTIYQTHQRKNSYAP
jgi:hypothetical protein